MTRNDLKIQFRAVPYTSTSHVLEYRVDPNQNLIYTKQVSLFGGLIKFNIKLRALTWWYKVYYFAYTSGEYDIDSDEHYLPLFCDTREEFNWYKDNFKTIGSFIEYIEKEEEANIKEFKVNRIKYLKSSGIYY